ncbi:MAG: tRNA pseudouridine(38-40) synthase TruA [SAR202 cluster bacterium]|nr:MAG: tRNA pseudouridine(38-40) synthase TruA [SAR202 cluster bacterium]|tara:strand:- start:3271 stop:4017 length:747 start_codon:yes stop_codon:yes gene_type:complete
MRLALIIEYEGTDYSGFQFQENASTIQGELEKSINCLTGDIVRIKGAGRTDAGVHAKNQVIAFDSKFSDDLEVYFRGINYYLPESISVKSIFEVSQDFDPRRDATSRVYKYTILNSDSPSPLLRRTTYFDSDYMDIEIMKKASQMFLGVHDFKKFCSPVKTGLSTVREIFDSKIDHENSLIFYTVEGNAFLPRQVRRMVGSLLKIAKGKMNLDELFELICAKGDNISPSLPANGLCLEKVNYEHFPNK